MHWSIPSLFALAALAASAPSSAQDAGKPVTDRRVTAVDVAATPMSDLNIRKDEIPAKLLAAQAAPYDLAGLTRCSQIAAEVGELDAMLGDDIDLPTADRGRLGGLSAGRVAQSALGSFIPFRGVIREVSGANEQERKMLVAIQAGVGRRAFLKGVGQARGCRYPARSATSSVLARRSAAMIAAAQAEAQAKDRKPH